MTRPRVDEADLRDRLAAALTIEDLVLRHKTANPIRRSLALLERRSTLPRGERQRVQGR